MVSRRLLIFMLGVLSCQAHAKYFRNSYVSFELPPQWRCTSEKFKWICHNEFENKTKQAMIILFAKAIGPNDTLASYLTHLQTPQPLPGRRGAPSKSQVVQVKERMINNQLWAEGVHFGSEAGQHLTRYLGTTRGRMAILVTLSARKESYSKYSGDFMRVIESLRVVAANSPGQGPANEILGTGMNGTINDPEAYPEVRAPGSRVKSIFWWVVILMLVGSGIYYYFWRRRRAVPKMPNRRK